MSPARTTPLTGLNAAPFTPFHATGDLHLEQVPVLADHLRRSGVSGVFVGGTTGEGLSLTVEERVALAEAWVEAPADLHVILQVGTLSQPDALRLAAHAGACGADALACLAPCYYRPATVEDLVDWCARVAEQAPDLPFYYYDIPDWTGVRLPMAAFAALAVERIPNFRGFKYTNTDLLGLQELLRFRDGALDVLAGNDGAFLAALGLGARGFVGSTYNFAAPLYHRIREAFAANDLEAARVEQARSVSLIRLLHSHGYHAAAKALMAMAGVDCGPVRPPLRPLDPEQKETLRRELETLGFFHWIAPEPASASGR